uniref:Uncharacterized protein n=1 Tax=uncultured marine microorganism HF4000_005I08 TaxID=455507 RepID=B3T0H2_9ZZZZ|nr:hypothetical protein ALOHA_HF4000005I08ctg1g8 [uncultured marine microorganism HF4000_005I08]
MRKSRLSKAKQKVKIRHIKQLVKECLTGLSGAAPNINEEVANSPSKSFGTSIRPGKSGAWRFQSGPP